MAIAVQIVWLFVLAIPIACVSWTVTHEEIFREPHEWCVRHSKNDRYILSRKFFYLFTCEYCFSHYVTIVFLVICDYKLLLNDWRGYFLAGFSLVFMANVYMSLFALLRQAIKKEKVEIEKIESETDTENSKN
ncbi:hypothetical protein [Flavobacterium luteolum]|uniref:hypothetical protein n=1 Tax=Flavobacterium luteolum TaxID=3003259 RepID=UPI00248D571D|nr:hypothetical protein [Flavobacterium luteolum]